MNTRQRIDKAIENIKKTMKDLSNSLDKPEEKELRRLLDQKPIEASSVKAYLDSLSEKYTSNIIVTSLQKTYLLLRVLIVNDEETIQPHLDEIERILRNRDPQEYVDGCQQVAKKFYQNLLGNSTVSLLTGTTDSANSNDTTVAGVSSITISSDVESHHGDRGLSVNIDSDDEEQRAKDEIEEFKKSSSCCFGFFKKFGKGSNEPLLLDTKTSDSRVAPKRV